MLRPGTLGVLLALAGLTNSVQAQIPYGPDPQNYSSRLTTIFDRRISATPAASLAWTSEGGAAIRGCYFLFDEHDLVHNAYFVPSIGPEFRGIQNVGAADPAPTEGAPVTAMHGRSGWVTTEQPEAASPPIDLPQPPPVRHQEIIPVINTSPSPSAVAEQPIILPIVETAKSNWTVGAAIYFLQPFYENNTAFVTLNNIGSPSPSRVTTDFDGRYSVSPAIWATWTGDGGLGVRARYFNFNQNVQINNANLTGAQGVTTAINPPAPLDVPVVPGAASFASPGILLAAGLGKDVLAFSSALRITAVDIEATCESDWGNWKVIYSCGGRYLSLAQNFTATLTNDGGGAASESQRLSFDHNFTGAGFTGAAQSSYHFGNSNLAIYGNVRGSLLIGRTHQLQSYRQEIVDPNFLAGGSQITTPFASTNGNTILPVFEVEMGLEYAVTFRRVGVAVRGAIVDQTYFTGGSASQTTGNLSLFGVTASLGLTF